MERVVYSTCSIHAIENEMVVRKALKEFPDFTLETVLPSWTRRGDASIFENGTWSSEEQRRSSVGAMALTIAMRHDCSKEMCSNLT